jgi:Raf kinase inhibitor-like YbhB/YbcL family protein
MAVWKTVFIQIKENLRMKRSLLTMAVLASSALVMAQGPGGAKGGGKGGPPRPAFSVSSSAFPDGGEIPAHFTFRGDNKSPAFEFKWMLGTEGTNAPEALQTYAVIFHDIENSTNKTALDTLHWSAFNIPGSAKGMTEGLAAGDLADGTRNGPGIASSRPNGTPSYFGPGAGPGPFHHYVFEFYALDTKLDLPANTTRDDLVKAMDGHIIGKAAYVGRYHAPAQ